MFYSEYRPQKFSELIGADHIVSAISGSLIKQTTAHAYFFTGTRGTGKTSTARLLAKSLNCTDPIQNEKSEIPFEPCNECKNCKSIINGSHVDIIEIDAASNRGIDNIRELRDNVGLSPSMGKNKIYIIDEVHMLTTEASNALLKTLEEPPSHAYFILCTTNPEKVLDTIKSRCIQFQFKRPSITDLIQKLKRIAKDKGHEIEDSSLKNIAVAAKGAFRDAETLLEQFLFGDKVDKNIPNDPFLRYAEFLKLMKSGDKLQAINLIHEIYSEGANIENWTESLINYARSLLMSKIGINIETDNFTHFEIDKSLSNEFSENEIKHLIELFNKAHSEFKSAVIPTLPLEIAIIDYIPAVQDKRPSEAALNVPKEKIQKEKPKTEPKTESINIKPTEPEKITEPVDVKPAPVEKKQVEPKSLISKTFPYKKLIQMVKPHNHSIHLVLHSCELANFDGETLHIRTFYSFHKERILSMKVREIIENVAGEIVGGPVVVKCELSTKNANAKKLTDKNIVPSSSTNSEKIDDVFEQVFGDDLVASTE